MAGSPVSGIDYLLIRPDGVGVIDARHLIRLASGAAVGGTAHGFLVAPYAMPPLQALVALSFTWPGPCLSPG